MAPSVEHMYTYIEKGMVHPCLIGGKEHVCMCVERRECTCVVCGCGMRQLFGHAKHKWLLDVWAVCLLHATSAMRMQLANPMKV